MKPFSGLRLTKHPRTVYNKADFVRKGADILARKKAAVGFGICAAGLALAVVLLCVFCRNASPLVFGGTAKATRQVSRLLSDVNTADAAVIASYFPEGTDLERMYSLDQPVADALTRTVWKSLSFELAGDARGTGSALAVDVKLRTMDAGKTLEQAKEKVRPLVNEKVRKADSLDAIFDADNQYKEEFLNAVLLEALDDTLKNPEMREQSITVYVRKTGGRWEILPEDSLMNALSGWMKE